MESFPEDLKSAVLAEADAEYQARKKKWLDHERKCIYDDLVFRHSYGKSGCVRILDCGKYAWELELMQELTHQENVKVEIYICYSGSRTRPGRRLLVKDWSQVIENDHQNQIEAEISFT